MEDWKAGSGKWGMTGKRFPSVRAALCIFLILALVPGIARADPDTLPPIILAKSPKGAISDYPVALEVTTDEPASCRYDTGYGLFDELEFLFAGQGTDHQDLLNLPEGQYTFFVGCRDLLNNTGMTENFTFTVDRTPPLITKAYPSGTLTSGLVELNVTTNEQAACRYDITNVPYDLLQETFDTTGRFVHKELLGKLPQAQYRYYVRCKDGAGNVQQDGFEVSFDVNLRPSAAVIIDGGDVLKAGTYEVGVSLSEELVEAPILKYNYNDDGNFRIVSLVGSGLAYHGYLIIPEDAADRIGTFSFSGIDLSGLSGTEITGGKLFIVDTRKPPAPLSLEVTNDRKGLELEWYYEGEEVDYFRIFRSELSSVDQINYLTRTTATSYLDGDVEDGTTYHYRISAVDKAGNEGDLSTERFLTADYGLQASEQVTLPASLSGSVKKQITLLDRKSLELEQVISDLSGATDADTVSVISFFDLLGEAKAAAQAIQGMRLELEGYLSSQLSEQELSSRLDLIDVRMERALKDVVKEIDIDQKSELVQSLEDVTIFQAIDDVFSRDLPDRASFEQEMLAINDKTDVNVKILLVRLLSFEKESSFALVEKSIRSEGSAGIVVEIIPKAVAQKASLVKSSVPPIVVKDDPVLRWNPSRADGFRFSYAIPGQKDINSMKTVRTVVLSEPVLAGRNASSGRNDSITGLASGNGLTMTESKGSWFTGMNFIMIIIGGIIVLGLAVYYFFFLKAEESYEAGQSGEASVQQLVQRKGREVPGAEAGHTVSPTEEKRHFHSAERRAASGHVAEPWCSMCGNEVQERRTQERQPAMVNPANDSAAAASSGMVNAAAVPGTRSHPDVGSVQLMRLMHHANERADALDVGQAYSYYLTLLDLYQYADQENVALHHGMCEVYDKLALMQAVKDVHACIDRKNVVGLRSALTRLQELRSSLAEEDARESALSSYARRAESFSRDFLKGFA
ncbi:MAG: hypothetical protein ABIJ21_03780 [Nanoarchaeota archaeon]